MPKCANYILLGFLIFLTLIYHVFNSADGRFCSSSWNPAPAPIELKVGTSTIAHFSRVGVIAPKSGCDASSRFISDWGHIGRYLLGQVHDRILKGRPSEFEHIYYREELPFLFNGLDSPIELAVVEQMRRFSANLTSQGAHVLWVPVPTKLALELDQIASPLPPESPWGATHLSRAVRQAQPRPYEIYRKWVERSDGFAVDLAKVFSDSRLRRREDLLYVPYDNHWSSFGIGVAAQAIAEKLRQAIPELRIPLLNFFQLRGVQHDHYLLSLLNLPSRFLNISPKFQWNEPLYSTEPPTKATNNGRLILAGTSQSVRLQGTGFSLGESLSRLLHRELIEESVVHGGLSGGLRKLHAKGVRVRSGDVVVWEFPDCTSLHPDSFPYLISGRILTSEKE